MSKHYITGGRDSHWFPTKAKTLASAKSVAIKYGFDAWQQA